VGRDNGENQFLRGYRDRYTHLYGVSHEGPLVLVDGTAGADDLEMAARITARFGQGRQAARVSVAVVQPGGDTRTMEVPPLPGGELPRDWYL
jgi:hypothetical protein